MCRKYKFCRTVTEQQQPTLKFHVFCYILLSAHLIVYVHKKFTTKINKNKENILYDSAINLIKTIRES
jgi:hypothetical protein